MRILYLLPFISLCALPQISNAQTKPEIKPTNVGDVLYKRAINIEYSVPYSKILSPNAFAAYENAASLGSHLAMERIGRDYFNNGDFEKAKLWLLRAVEAGNISSNYNLGKIYLKEGNCALAMSAFQKIENIIYDVPYLIADAYSKKLCTPPDSATIINLYEKQAKFGQSQAIFKLANKYFDGIETNKNLARAWAYSKISTLIWITDYNGEKFSRADAKGLFEKIDAEVKAAKLETAAFEEMKTICESGTACYTINPAELPTGIKVSYPPAPPAPPPPPAPMIGASFGANSAKYKSEISKDQKAVLDDAFNKAFLAEKEYRKNIKGRLDFESLRAAYLESANLGGPLSMYAIARLYIEEGKEEKGFEYLGKAAENGSYQAQYAYAKYLIENKKDCVIAAEYLNNAWRVSTDSTKIAIYKGALYSGNICQGFKDEQKSFTNYLTAAQNGNLDSIQKIGEYYANGFGVQQSTIRALSWYRIAYYSQPNRGFFAPSIVKQTKALILANSKNISTDERNQIISLTYYNCTISRACSAISESDLMKMQTIEID